MKILALLLLVAPLWACQTQGRFENAGRKADDVVGDVREGAKDVIDDVRDGAQNARDDVRRRRR